MPLVNFEIEIKQTAQMPPKAKIGIPVNAKPPAPRPDRVWLKSTTAMPPVTTATRPRDLEGSISILGEKGTVEIGGFAVNEMKVWDFTEKEKGDKEVLLKYRSNPPNVYGFGHYEYIKDVIKCINNDEKAIVDGLEGRKSLELINAIYESVETKREVHLRFRPQRCKLGIQNELK